MQENETITEGRVDPKPLMPQEVSTVHDASSVSDRERTAHVARDRERAALRVSE